MGSLSTTLGVRGRQLETYNAGSVRGETHFGVFPRDLLTTGLMLRDPRFLRETIRLCAHTIGRRPDPATGEEPGRVLHEWNHVERDGLSTHYNAVETSHLLLIASRELLALSPEATVQFLQTLRSELSAAGRYVLSHLRDGLFLEDPAHCGAARYFAMATYWKDSHLPGRETLTYPVAYTLVQAQTVAALRAMAVLTGPFQLGWEDDALRAQVDRGVNALWSHLWDESLGCSLIALDQGTPVSGISSDALHVLAYLEPGDVPRSRLTEIQAVAALLETPYGYRSYAPDQTDYAPDAYHLGSIWPYEQTFIARGALQFELTDVFAAAGHILTALEEVGFPELLVWNGQAPSRGGCDVQLWTCAVPRAFEHLCKQSPTNRRRTERSTNQVIEA